MEILMAIVDFIPVSLYLAGAVLLMRKLYPYMSKGAFAVFSSGNIFVFTAGVLKATWKLLYYAGICDFTALQACFFPMQTIGFLLAAAGIVAMLFFRQGEDVKKFFAVPIVTSSMPFVVLMVLGVGVMYASLAYVGVKKKKPAGVACFCLALVFTLAMGYLSSRDFTKAIYNWIAEFVNIAGQGLFLAGAWLLFRDRGAQGEQEPTARD